MLLSIFSWRLALLPSVSAGAAHRRLDDEGEMGFVKGSPELHCMVAELAARAHLPKPKVGISHLRMPLILSELPSRAIRNW
ncbi:hypothetical protein ACFLTJ_03205 [Chloroflexota bacterium]